MSEQPSIIQITGLRKEFTTKSGVITALSDIHLDIKQGEIFGIIGLSGAGKSTLVRCINMLEKPTDGKVVVNGSDMTALRAKELLKARQSIGMIFQGFHLLMQRTAIQNICFPLEISGVSRDKAKERARELLEIVGLTDRESSYPSQLSGGQKQRVAIARALATNPKVLLCDEATSALDPTTTRSILALLKEINQKLGVTIVIITHEMSVIEKICHRVAIIDQSKIVEQGRVDEIFVRPQSEIAKQLIFPEGRQAGLFTGKHCLRIVFDGNSSFDPVIGNMILDCGYAVNILFADTKDIDGKAYGQILIQLPDNERAIERIKNYLSGQKNVHYEEEEIRNE